MLDFRRIGAFVCSVLLIALPFLVVVFVLAGATEVLTQGWPWEDGVTAAGFWSAVLVDMAPAIAVMFAVLWLAGRFVSHVYQLDGWRQGFRFILFSRCGLPSFAPWAKVEKGGVAEGGDELLEKIGGRGSLVVYNDSAVVLERGGRLTRVEGKGFPRLEPFEKIYDVIDLRPKQYCYDVSALTREGIRVDWEVEVRYQIGDGGQLPTAEDPYPLSKKDVFRAATCKWRREEGFRHGQDMDWEGLIVVSRTEGTFRSMISRRWLDELIAVDEDSERAVREALQSELREALENKAPALGARILDVRLGNLRVSDQVTEQWIKAWKAHWQRWSSGLLAQGEAAHIYMYETAKAEAQMSLVLNIAQALERQLAARRLTPAMVNQIVLMRLFSVLDRASFAASSRTFFPAPALEMLENMRHLLDRGDAQLPEGG